MRKFAAILVGAALAGAVATAAGAFSIGPHAARCDAGESSVIVNVTGFRARTGTVRVQIYHANQRTMFERRQWLVRVDVPVTRSGDMPICVPVSAPGRYAVSVRHDLNGNGNSDRADGGGFSGNPDVSLLDMMFRRKPAVERVAFSVGQGAARQTVILNYIQGSSFDPLPRN